MRSISARFAQFFALARGEMRLAFADAPAFAWQAMVVVAWATTAIAMGSLIGIMAVILPPTAIFGVILLFAVLLLWVTPDLPIAPDKLIRRMLFVALVVDLCLPTYYTVQVAQLPWISARRVVTFPLIVLFAVAFSTSREARQRIGRLVSANRFIAICVFGFPVAAFLSIFTSIVPPLSMSSVLDIIIEWYVPFAVMLYVLREKDDVELVVRIILWCALFISVVGILDFVFHRNLYVDVMPKVLIDSLMSNNPAFAAMVTAPQFRNGMYRANSVFGVSLSFAEFEALMILLAAVFAVHGRTTKDRALGVVIVLASLAGIFASGSRGGYVSVIVGCVSLTALYLIRTNRFEPVSLRPAIVGAIATGGFVVLFGLILFWPKMHSIVLGGGMESYSDEGRRIQWAMGTPKILANPITGHGYAMGGEVVGYPPGEDRKTVDSFLLATLVETGLLGTVSFFGAILFSIWVALRRYVFDRSWQGALMGGLGSTLLAYLTYRLVLAQRENVTLMYLLVACVMFLNSSFQEDKAQEPLSQRSDNVSKLRSRTPAQE